MATESTIDDTIMQDLLMEEDELENDTLSSAEEDGTVDAETQERRNWVLFMRHQFSVRPDFPCTNKIIKPNGRLNQEYFWPAMEADAKDDRVWTDVEANILIQGIEKHGIGNWKDIAKEFPTEWTSIELRLKCIRLIGRQNLQLYKDWKGNADEISREYETNKRIGLKFDSWKQNVLIYDDQGEVEKELIQLHKQMCK